MAITATKKCRDKTAKGNVFTTKKAASKAAFNWNEKLKRLHKLSQFNEAYECPICKKWHYGRPLPIKEKP